MPNKIKNVAVLRRDYLDYFTLPVQELNRYICTSKIIFDRRRRNLHNSEFVPISERQCRPMISQTGFGIGISEVRSLCGVDITGLAASLLTFPGGLACIP